MIEKLSEMERNMLLRFQLVPLLNRTIDHMRATGREPLAMEWDMYSNILITLVTTARQEIFDARQKRASKVQDRPDETL